jgi:hypothetical protein
MQFYYRGIQHHKEISVQETSLWWWEVRCIDEVCNLATMVDNLAPAMCNLVAAVGNLAIACNFAAAVTNT